MKGELKMERASTGKRYLVLIMAMVIVVLTALGGPKPSYSSHYDTANIPLENSGFEQTSGLPGWSVFGTPAELAASSIRAYEGVQSLKLVDSSTTSNAGAESDRVSLLGAKEYRGSAQVYIESISSGHTADLYLNFYDAQGSKIGMNPVVWQSVGSPLQDWTTLEVSGTAPSHAVEVSLLLVLGKSVTGTVYFDEVKLEQYTENFDFEEPASNQVPMWSPFGAPSDLSISSTRAYEGSQSLKLSDQSTTSNGGAISSRVTVAPKTQYQASSRVYIESVSGGGADIYLNFYDASGAKLAMNPVLWNSVDGPSQQWTELKVTGTAPANAVSAEVMLIFGKSVTGVAYFDQVTIEPLMIGTFTNLGTQVTAAKVLGGAFGEENGEPVLYSVISAEPAKFISIRVSDGSLIRMIDLPDAKGAWSLARSDTGLIYIATYDSGRLYRYSPGDANVVDLGQPIAGESYLWDIKPGPSGKIYGGTYPNGKTFEYNPATNQFTDYGPMSSENYVRSVAYDAASHVIYAGIGPHAKLTKFDISTHTKQDMLPVSYADKEWVYDVDIAGGKLFAKINPSADMLVYDIQSQQVEYTIPLVGSYGVSPLSPSDDKVYYTTDQTLHYYDISDQLHASLNVDTGGYGAAYGFVQLDQGGFSDDVLAVWTREAKLLKYDMSSGQSEILIPELPEQALEIRSIVVGSDGHAYSGGFLAGGLGEYDPVSGTQVQYKGVGQAEGSTALGGKLYFGVYPGAAVVEYDPAFPGVFHERFRLDAYDQDRPFAMLGVEDENKLFIGTVTKYGKLGGVLASYDPSTGAYQANRHVIADQSIISLAYKDGFVYGGSSIYGGLGAVPTATEAKMFIWDVANEVKVAEFVPVPGKRAITELITGPDGSIWGVAEDTLFVFDPSTNQVVYSKAEFSADYSNADHIWEGASFALGTNGLIYGTFEGRFFRIDPATKVITDLRSNASTYLATDGNGNFYFKDVYNLWRYTEHAQ